MMISIGILAHNEEHQIGELIEDLGRQTLFGDNLRELVVHVVANGCKDRTGDVSREKLAAVFAGRPNIKWQVHDVIQPGKANAWNEFIHRFASEKTDFIFMLDADIRILDATTMALTVDALDKNQQACVAVDEPVKDLRPKHGKSAWERLVLSFSQTAQNVRNSVSGSFYCARYSVLKEIWLPTGTIGEDGFLRAMLLTDRFRKDEDLSRLVFVEGARHYFETRTEFGEIMHHQVRLAMGTGINVILFGHLREKRAENIDAGQYVRDKNKSDPKWIQGLIEQEMAKRYFVMDPRFTTRRFRRLKTFGPIERLKKAPVYLAGAIVDFFVYFQANRLMRKGAALGFW